MGRVAGLGTLLTPHTFMNEDGFYVADTEWAEAFSQDGLILTSHHAWSDTKFPQVPARPSWGSGSIVLLIVILSNVPV